MRSRLGKGLGKAWDAGSCSTAMWRMRALQLKNGKPTTSSLTTPDSDPWTTQEDKGMGPTNSTGPEGGTRFQAGKLQLRPDDAGARAEGNRV